VRCVSLECFFLKITKKEKFFEILWFAGLFLKIKIILIIFIILKLNDNNQYYLIKVYYLFLFLSILIFFIILKVLHLLIQFLVQIH